MDEPVRIVGAETLSQNWGILKRTTLDVRRRDGALQRLVRETYELGNAAAILLVDPPRGNVVLVRQFRLPLLLSGQQPLMLEVCAGLLDGDEPLACAMREAEEETGFRPTEIVHVLDIHPSPGSVIEKVSLFIGRYEPGRQVSGGGGLSEEGEEIEVVELAFSDALGLVRSGGITDAKTVLLLQHAALAKAFG